MISGEGRIVLRSHGSDVAFSELSASYPLKLLSPRVHQEGTAMAYVVSYGGGLVGGDCIKLSVDIGQGCNLLLLSQVFSPDTSSGIAGKLTEQGSTKVFKTRPGGRAATQLSPRHEGFDNTTQSTMEVIVSRGGALFLLPDPVTCFRSARYNQIQRFRLSGDASVVLLDWITCGRKSLGEEWAFTKYYSVNELWVDGKRLLKDALLLEDDQTTGTRSHHPPRALHARLAPYSCYANLILYGPRVRGIIDQLSRTQDSISVLKFQEPPGLIWSLSPVSNEGCIIRVAGKDSEPVKQWLKNSLLGLENIVGIDVYRRAFV